MLSASEQPAFCAGSSTVFVGFRILAVSAMNFTPQKTMMSLSVLAALRLSSSESPTEIGDGVIERRLHVVVAQDHRVLLALQPVDLDGQLGFVAQLEIGGVVPEHAS